MDSHNPVRSQKHAPVRAANKSLLALALLAAPLAAQAQESPVPETDRDAEVIDVRGRSGRTRIDVSANSKFTRSLLDTPQTVQVVTQDMLREQGSMSLMDALRNTPGITMQLGENGNTSAGDTFQMRGFSTSTSTFVDGIRDLGAVSRDAFNLEQVEIAKGPAGADVGRGAASGYVNLITKQPARDLGTAVTAGYGTADNKRVTFDTGVNLGASGAARLNVLMAEGGVAKRDVVDNTNVSIAPSLAFGLGTETRVYVLSQHVRQDNTPDGGIPAVGRAGYSVMPSYTASGVRTENDATHALAAAINAAPPVARENFYGYTGDNEDVEADMVTVRIEHDLGANTVIRNISRAGTTGMERVLSGSNSPAVNASTTTPGNALYLDPDDPASWAFAPSRQRIDRTDEILTNQTSFNSTLTAGGLEHALTGGVEFIYERQKSNNFGTTAMTINGVSYPAIENPPNPFYAPDPGLVRGIPHPNGVTTDGDTTTAAVYLFDSVELDPQWILNAGFRYESYETETESTALTNGVVRRNAPLADADRLFGWKVGAVYKPVDAGSVYASYATSQTPPGSANFLLSATAGNQNNAALDPQETDNVEIGTKWQLFDAQLNLTAAVFRTENSRQASFDDLGNALQIGRTRVEGIEVAAVGQVTNFWQVSAGVTKMDVDVLDQQNSGGVDTVGVRWTPELSATLWTSYTAGDLTIGGGARYFDEQARNVTSNAAVNGVAAIPSYWVADAMAAYRLSETINLRVNLYNLTDEEYIETLNNGGNRLRLGQPRSVWLTGEYRF
ncbi:MAG: TonB-dependent receptor domain-containing protein [Gammaproteobacteria bacterium]